MVKVCAAKLIMFTIFVTNECRQVGLEKYGKARFGEKKLLLRLLKMLLGSLIRNV